MSTPFDPTDDRWEWPADRLAALRLGQRLVTEVPASGSGRRAFVDITPRTTPADAEAAGQGWKRADHARTFTLRHWDYEADRLDGFDYDVGAVLVKAATVLGELELTAALEEWALSRTSSSTHGTPTTRNEHPSTASSPKRVRSTSEVRSSG